MRRLVLISLCAALVLVVAACGGGSQSVDSGSVAVVGDQQITKAQWDALIAQTKRNFLATKRAFPKPGEVIATTTFARAWSTTPGPRSTRAFAAMSPKIRIRSSTE